MKKPNQHMTLHSGAVISSLVAMLAVASLAGCSTQQSSDSDPSAVEPRVIRQFDLPLRSADADPGIRTFAGQAIRGTLDASGDWQVRGEIQHPRLRCATYRIGLQFGSGEGACSAATWLTPALPLTSRRQCNNATLIHSGDGSLGLPAERLSALNCVRVSVRCTGACG